MYRIMYFNVVSQVCILSGIRAFMEDVIGALKCHMDVQASDGRGMLLRYVAGYVPKFSDSFAQTWLNDQASDYAVARRVLTDYHPCEPEMWLQLGAQWFPQTFAGGTMKVFTVPVPDWDAPCPEKLQAYVSSAWRGDDMSLLEFLRRANAKGDIQRYLRRRHEKEGGDMDLETFARTAQTRGEVLVATKMYSRFNQKYFGQWLMLNKPFRNIAD